MMVWIMALVVAIGGALTSMIMLHHNKRK